MFRAPALAIAALLITTATAPTTATAAPRLIQTEQAADAIRLTFNERLLMMHSDAVLVTANAEGEAVAATITFAPNRRTMIITPAAPLAPGQYRLQYTTRGPGSEPALHREMQVTVD